MKKLISLGTQWNAGDQVLADDLNDTFASLDLSIPVIAAEDLVTGNAVSSCYYQSDGGIKYDNKATAKSNYGFSGGSQTTSFTVANNSNRMLIVYVNVGFQNNSYSAPSPVSVKYNGVPMTLITTTATGSPSPWNKLCAYYLANPAVGANNLVVDVTGSYGSNIYISTAIVSYYNVSSYGGYFSNGSGS